MTAAPDTRLSVTASGDREIVMRRVFKAPRELVFDAWTKPELLTRWFGRRDWTVPECEIDLRPGGGYRYVLRGPDGSDIVMRGSYREVVPPERLVSTEAFEGFSEVGWRPEDETVSTMVLVEANGQTLWTMTTRYPSTETRDAALHLEPAWTGMGESLDRLEQMVQALTPENGP